MPIVEYTMYALEALET